MYDVLTKELQEKATQVLDSSFNETEVQDLAQLILKLRNSTNSIQNQDILRDHFDTIFNSISTVLEKLEFDTSTSQLFTYALQWMANFIAGNPLNQTLLWEKGSTTLGKLLDKVKHDIKTVSILSIILYSLAMNNPDRRKYISKTHCKSIKDLILLSKQIDINDDTFFDIFLLLKKLFLDFDILFPLLSDGPNESEQSYSILTEAQQQAIQLFDAILDTSEGSTFLENLSSGTFELLDRIVKEYNSADQILKNADGNNIVVSTAYSIFQIVSNLMSNHHVFDLSVIENLVEQLKHVWLNTKPQKKYTLDPDNVSPIFGLKVILTEIIANASFHNRSVQDMVREAGGLIPILDGCQYDETNPYLREWSVFAIRNLCEENSENQSFVAKLKESGERTYNY